MHMGVISVKLLDHMFELCCHFCFPASMSWKAFLVGMYHAYILLIL